MLPRLRLAKNDAAYAASLFLLAALARIRPVWDVDLWWQLAEARWIWRNRAFPSTDVFTYGFSGTPYLALEWATGMVYLAAHSLFSERGLLLLAPMLFGLLAVLFFALVRMRGSSPWLGWLWTVLFLCLAFQRFPLRPEMWSNLFLLTLCILEARGAGPLPHFLALAAWPNFHGEFMFGLVYLAIGWAAEPSRTRAVRALAALVGSLCNPYGWRALGIPLYYFLHQAYEFQTTVEGHNALLFRLALASALAAAAAFFENWRRRREDPRIAPPPLREVLLVLAFGFQALRVTRICVLFYVVALPAIVSCAARLSRSRVKPPARGPALALALVVLAAASRASALFSAWERPMDYRSVPEGAARFLESVGADGRVFNSHGLGGYLEWRLWPKVKVFCDGRYLVTPLVYELWRARQEPAAWDAFLGRYGADFAVVDWVWEGAMLPILGKGWNAEASRSPYEYLFPRDRWALLYWDHFTLVLARIDSANRADLSRRALRLTEPLAWERTLERVGRGEVQARDVLEELSRVRGLSGGNWLADKMEAQIRQVAPARAILRQ